MNGIDTRPVHDDKALTDLSIAYSVEKSDLMSLKNPAKLNVRKQTDFYYVWSKNDLYRILAGETVAGTETPGGKINLTKGTYACVNIGLHEDIPAEEIANQDEQIDVETESVEYITSNILLKDESKFFKAIYGPNKWTGSATGVDLIGGTDFVQFNEAGADPILMVDLQKNAMKEETGIMPNTIMIDPASHAYLRNSEELKDRIKYTQKGFISNALLAEAFGVDNYWVAYGTRNKAAAGEGIVSDFEFFAPKDTMWLGYVESRPGKRKPSAYYAFYWDEPLKVSGANYRDKMGVGMRAFYMKSIDSLRIEGKIFSAYKIVAPDLGMFFTETIDRT